MNSRLWHYIQADAAQPGLLFNLKYLVLLGALVTLATLGCLALLIAFEACPTWYLWPKGKLFSLLAPLGTFRQLKLSGFIESSMVFYILIQLSYFGYFGLLSLGICLGWIA